MPVRSSALTQPRAASPSAAERYVVQLSTQKSHQEASASFRAIQAKYPSVLGGREMLIRQQEVAGKGTFYGAQVGPFATREEANRLCAELKSAGGSCLVQRN